MEAVRLYEQQRQEQITLLQKNQADESEIKKSERKTGY